MLPKYELFLDGHWNLLNQNGTIKTSIIVPGSIFEALIRDGVIPDPFYGDNEKKVNNVSKCNWLFEKKFDVEKYFLQYPKILLRFEGIDTFSQIEFNGEFLGTTDNMFRTYEFNIKDLVKLKNNILKVFIKSPVSIANKYINQYKSNLKNFEGFPGAPYLRKAQFSFGWDWAPVLPDIGIWRSVRLIFFDAIRIDDYYVDMNFKYNIDPSNIVNAKDWTKLTVKTVFLRIHINLSLYSKEILNFPLNFRCKITAPDNIIYEKKNIINNQKLEIEFRLDYPYLWWTNDLGFPNLYKLEFSIEYKGMIIDKKAERFGIRDVKLIRKVDKWGETFYFQLNGIPLFAKGANWVPIDSLISRGKRIGLIQKNIENAVQANINMLRVWGGGIYEEDLFYELCDQKGILVWQDFPFACAIYPIHKEFIQNVKEEAIDNIKRLRNHPSLALWCGNNEIEQLWKLLLIISEIRDANQIKQYEKGYLQLFKSILPKVLNTYDPRHQYWPSSALDKFDGSLILSDVPNNPESGDSHYWEVWHGSASFQAYETFNSRFMSEFGFESFPSLKTIKAFCPPEQHQFQSSIMKNHQKNKAGNKKIFSYMKKRFNISKNFEHNIILSQLTQAEAIEYGVEHWRRNRNEFHCMGALYWQLNDCWPVISWSSIDYYGRWKALHYYAKRFFNPLFVSVRQDNDMIEVWITNDLKTMQSIELTWKVYKSNSELVKESKIDGFIEPLSSYCWDKIKVSDFILNSKKPENIIIFYKWGSKNQEKNLYSGMKLMEAPKKLEIENPNLQWDIQQSPIDDGGNFSVQITIKNDKIALYVYIDSDIYDFIASDNFFSMEPNETRIIIINNIKYVQNGLKLNQIVNKRDFTVNSLYDLITFVEKKK